MDKNIAISKLQLAFTPEELEHDLSNWEVIAGLNRAAKAFLEGKVNGIGFLEMAEPYVCDTEQTMDNYVNQIEKNLNEIDFNIWLP